MRIEAFTEGKLSADPASNEDRLLILPGRGFAVIDRVTDRTGDRYDGLLAGQLAARTARSSGSIPRRSAAIPASRAATRDATPTIAR